MATLISFFLFWPFDGKSFVRIHFFLCSAVFEQETRLHTNQFLFYIAEIGASDCGWWEFLIEKDGEFVASLGERLRSLSLSLLAYFTLLYQQIVTYSLVNVTICSIPFRMQDRLVKSCFAWSERVLLRQQPRTVCADLLYAAVRANLAFEVVLIIEVELKVELFYRRSRKEFYS